MWSREQIETFNIWDYVLCNPEDGRLQTISIVDSDLELRSNPTKKLYVNFKVKFLESYNREVLILFENCVI